MRQTQVPVGPLPISKLTQRVEPERHTSFLPALQSGIRNLPSLLVSREPACWIRYPSLVSFQGVLRKVER